MSKYKPKAEVMFEVKMKAAIRERDFDKIADLFHMFGCYLNLIEPPPPPKTKALELVPRDEPTWIEEQQYILSGGAAQFEARLEEITRYNDDQIKRIHLGMPTFDIPF